MYNRDQFLDKGAKSTLDNHRREMEERKLSMLRAQRAKELKDLETKLYYKKQEVARVKSIFERLKREAVLKQNSARKEKVDLESGQRQVKDAEERLRVLEQEIARSLSDVADRIKKEKEVIVQHQRALDGLEAQKREMEGKQSQQKRTLSETVSRLLFTKKRDQQEATKSEQMFTVNQTQLHGAEESLKQFTQEVAVLENKIRSLRNSHV